MKKVLGLLVFIFLLNGCDDGDLTVATADFGDVTPTLCVDNPSVMYKINSNDTETMILVIDDGLDPYPNVVGVTGPYAIGSIAEVVYRRYDGAISSNNVCATIQPGSPSLAEEWIATTGEVLVTTTAVNTTPDPETGATKILRYKHKIEFLNIVFAKSDGGNQIYETLLYGDYLGPTVTAPQFNFDEELTQCSSNGTIFKINLESERESLIIKNIDPNLIKNVVGIESGPISLETNVLVYQSYTTNLPDPSDYFCAATTPLIPLVNETWTGVPGNETTGTGMIKVETVANSAGSYTHTITLEKVTFYNAVSNSSFYYGNSILYGKLITE